MKILMILFLFLVVSINSTNAQCSDAGVCSIAGHQEVAKNNSLSFSLGYGYSGKDDDISFKTINIDGLFSLSDNSFITIKLPYNFQSGPLGSVDGLGDLTALANYKIYDEVDYNLLLTGGVKLASSKLNSESKLPQAYQSGLGTNDLLFGATVNYSQFSFSIGYQFAGGRNTRTITKLERGDDLLIKGGYSFNVNDFSISPELLFIKRLGKSSVANPVSGTTNFVEIANSDQSQINLLVNISKSLDDDFTFKGSFALPFLERDVNVDGLTRKFTVSAGISYSF